MQIVIPHDRLKPETLRAVIEEFVTRDGAIQGHTDKTLDAQIESVRRQLETGKVVIVFDDEAESCTICLADEMRKANTDETDSMDHSIESKEP